MAGIQINDNGETSWVRFTPRDEKFFIDIHAAIHPKDLCDTSYDDWYLCHATYECKLIWPAVAWRPNIFLYWGASVY